MDHKKKKLHPSIWILFAAALSAACHRPAVETLSTTSPPSPELVAIDSLMWTQPDNALNQLIQYYDTVSDRHYANLLLAELLYKNYYEQTNRLELRKAVAYYDSLSCPFFSARSHYINGVGYYEQDSLVPACEEYLKAVEIMEDRFSEKELTGHKAMFMAMAYTRLTDIFSDLYLHEQTIHLGKQSLLYYDKYDAEPWHVAWMLDKIGSHFEMMQQLDSAECYFDEALAFLPDTNCLTYRDISTVKAILLYDKEKKPQSTLNRLYSLLLQAESKKEYFARSLVIGEIFFHEKQLDSAYYWLKNGFIHTENIESKIQSALWLKEICDTLGMTDEMVEYTRFLAENTVTGDYKSILYTELSELYQSFRLQQQEVLHQKKARIEHKKQYLFTGLLSTIIVGVGLLILRNRRKKIKTQEELLVAQREKNKKTETEKKHLLSECERLESELNKKNEKPLDVKNCYKNFRKEPACQSIVSSIHAVHIKTERKVSEYKESALTPTTYRNYLIAINKHGPGSLKELKTRYPRLTNAEIKLCCLALLDLENKEMAVLLQISHQAVGKQMNSLLEKMGKRREELFPSLASVLFSQKE